MIEQIIHLSVKNKLVVGLLVIGLIAGGIYSLQQLPIDAVPDITNNQVQVVTVSQSLAPQEVEQFITYPIEVAMSNIPNVTEIRSISRFGLSVVTIVFKDKVPILESRQFVKEQISMAQDEIPDGLGAPELMPITTGLGEIYQYVLKVKPGYEDQFDAMELRTIQDWIVKRQLAGTTGIIEISSFGGFLKQYEIALTPLLLESMDISIGEVFEALQKNNQNSGGSYIEKNSNAFYIRSEGVIKDIDDIKNIVIKSRNGLPVFIKDVGEVGFGSPKRFGAMTMDGKGEAVGGITLMLKGGNSSEAIANVHDRIEEVKKSLPEGVELYPYLDRSDLVGNAIQTVKTNLLEGGIIVIFVLVLLLGDIRAGLIVASLIPLSMLFAIILMNYFGISANLMSLGAIDFGIVVDGAVIIVEGVLHTIFTYHVGKKLTQSQMDGIITEASSKLFRSAVFGVIIILVVFIPIMTLTGIEGKMFRPMAMTFSFAVLGAMLLSLTYVPMMASLVLKKQIRAHESLADKLIGFLRRLYRPTLDFILKIPGLVIGSTIAVFIVVYFLFQSMGAEFIPTLEEGDLAMQMTIQPGSSLRESVKSSTKAEQILLDNFPEIEHVVSKIGTAEVPTDPMAIEDADIMIILKAKEEWISASTRDDLVDKMKEKLAVIPGVSFEFTQPIQLRFNELMTGAKTDIAVKIFGENNEILKQVAEEAASYITGIDGAGDVKVEQTDGLPQLVINFNRAKIGQYGLNIEDLNTLIRTAYAGETAGVVFENERKFDLVVRLNEAARENVNLNQLFVHLDNGNSLPLSEVATVQYVEGPALISREDAKRRINIGINVRNRDVASLVADIEQTLADKLDLPPGYSIKYGGQFENLEKAKKRLGLAVPAALLLIFVLLYFTFEKIKYALLIFTAVPLSAIGGVLALWLRDMPFSISAGVGFIALFGVAVLNGIVMISYFNQLRYEKGMTNIREVVIEGSLVRLRPVIMTATVAALGFLPMALSTGNGAEVQKPLATVVIGGLITSTMLTLVLLPILYNLVNKNVISPGIKVVSMVLMLMFAGGTIQAQQAPVLTLDAALENALQNHPAIENATLDIQRAQLGIQSARQIPATDITLETGQVNSDLFDYKVGINQSFGNPAANKSRKSLAEANISLSEKTLEQLQRQINLEIKQAWHNWQYQNQHMVLLDEQYMLMREFVEKATAAYESGETGRLEKTLAESELLKMERALITAETAKEEAYARVLQSAFLTEDYTIAPEQLSKMELPAFAESFNGSFTSPLEQKIEVTKQETVLQQKMVRPEFSIGYFNQSIRPDYSFQGVQAGVSLPLWKKAQQAKVQQTQISELQALNNLEHHKQLLDQELAFAQKQAFFYHEELLMSGQKMQQQSTTLRELAKLQFQEGEINYFDFVQSLNIAFDNDLEYLKLLHKYNQSALYLEYISE
jgi:cobalt-zinc-cadmium resistance protein CzcA